MGAWVRGAGGVVSGEGGPTRCNIPYAKCGDAVVEQVEQRIRLGGHGSSFLVLFDQLGVEDFFLGAGAGGGAERGRGGGGGSRRREEERGARRRGDQDKVLPPLPGLAPQSCCSPRHRPTTSLHVAYR